MISTLERLIRLVDEYDLIGCETRVDDPLDTNVGLDERDVLECQLLSSPVSSDADAVAKLRYLTRIMGDGERSDGLDIEALGDMADWMERRFASMDNAHRVVAA